MESRTSPAPPTTNTRKSRKREKLDTYLEIFWEHKFEIFILTLGLILALIQYGLQLFLLFNPYTPFIIGGCSFLSSIKNLMEIPNEPNTYHVRLLVNVGCGILALTGMVFYYQLPTIAPALLGGFSVTGNAITCWLYSHIQTQAKTEAAKRVENKASHIENAYGKEKISPRDYKNRYFENDMNLLYAKIALLTALVFFLLVTAPYIFPVLASTVMKLSFLNKTATSIIIFNKALELIDTNEFVDYRISRWYYGKQKEEGLHERSDPIISPLPISRRNNAHFLGEKPGMPSPTSVPILPPPNSPSSTSRPASPKSSTRLFGTSHIPQSSPLLRSEPPSPR